MDILIIIVGLALLLWFKGTIKKLAGATENVLNTVIETSEDSLSVYSNDMKISNGKARGLQRKKIEKLTEEDNFSTQSEIDEMLNILQKDDKDKD